MKAVLMLEDGTEFAGRGFGAPGLSFGEVIFSTSMTGYQELLTDPSYCGQILVCTAAHVGNVGINAQDHESGRAWLAGFVVQDAPRKYSNWRADLSLDSWLVDHNVVGLCDVDTRAVVKHLREKGAMRGAVCSGEIPSDLLRRILDHPDLTGRDLVSEVTCAQATSFGDSGLHVVAFDFGMKQHMMNLMKLHGLRVTRVPATTTAAEVMALKPDGVFLSNGPGDPAALQSVVDEINGLMGKVPIFGICLGHQLLGRALGGETYKLKFGHHGSNHPVKDLSTGRVEITTQNHGFAVDPQSLGPEVKQTHVNLNDGTCEGIACPEKRAFSVQYHPENAPGPHDSRYLFERFVSNMEASCAQKN
jgi:carbamoyl-phosphate synthase small subunit